MRKSFFGGYPYVEPVSKQIFPDEERWDKENDILDVVGKYRKLEQYHNALDEAEKQIYATLQDDPFLPQDFGFVETEEKIPGEGFTPTVYRKDKHLLARVPDTEHDWYISGIGTVYIPNADFAYFLLRGLNIITDQEVEGETIISTEN